MTIQRNINLWQIKGEFQSLLTQLYDTETGEIDMDIDSQLNALSETAENKFIAIASWIKNMESEKRQLDFMKQEILRRELAYQKEIDKRLDYLKNGMEGCGITEVKCPYFTLKIKKNPHSTEIIDLSQVPQEYIRNKEVFKIEISADKNAIKEEVLKTGVQIPGAYVQQKTKLEILTDKI